VVLAAVDPATSRDLTLVLPNTTIGIYYETVKIGSDGSVTVVTPSVVEEQLPVEEPVVSEVVEAEVTEGSETTLVVSSDFDQWYSNNRDAILAAWSNAISGLDLDDSTENQTTASSTLRWYRLSQLYNETLRSLYGSALPWDGETVVETDVVVTEEFVLVDEPVADVVVDEVTTSSTDGEFTEISATTVTDSRDFEQLYDGDAEAVSEERLVAVNDQMIQGGEQVEEQIDVEQIETADLSFRPVVTSDRSLSMMTDVDSAMDRNSGFVSFSERPGESDLTGGSSGLSNEIDETSFLRSGDDQITISSSVRAGSLIVTWELEVLDKVFENLSFL